MKSLCAYILLPLLMLVVPALWSCGGDERQVVEQLDCAESYLPACPDSAAILLDSLDAAMKGGGWDESSEAFHLYGLLRTMTDDMLLRGIHTDSLIRPTYIYYKERMDENDWSASAITTRRYARSAFYLGLLESSRDSMKQAEDLYRKAIKFSEVVEDWHTCYLAYCYLAKIYVWSDVGYVLNCLESAHSTYDKVNDKVENLCYILEETGRCYILLSDTASALDCFRQSYSLAVEGGLELRKYEVFRYIASVYNALGENAKALTYAKLGMGNVAGDVMFNARLLLSSCYEECDSLLQARDILLDMLDEPLTRNRYFIFKGLGRVSAKMKDYDAARIYNDSASINYESMYVDVLKDNNEYAKDVENIGRQIDKLNLENTRQRISVLIIVFLCALLLFMIATLCIRIVKKQKTARIKLVEKSRQYNSIQRESNRKELAALASKAKHATAAMQRMQNYNIEHTAIYRLIADGKINCNDLSDTYYTDIKETLDVYADNFASRLLDTFPNLDKDDQLLIMLIRMGFSIRQTADFFNRSTEAIRSRRKKIMKTLFTNQYNVEQLNNVIMNF